MSGTDLSEKSSVAEFTKVALESLTEAVRRALVEHMRRGQKVPEWNGSAVVWVDPGQHLHTFPVRRGANSKTIDVEKTDIPIASHLERG